jgi:hypothetical protein
MRDLFGDEHFEIRPIAHSLGFGTRGEIGEEAAHRRQMESLEHAFQIVDLPRRIRGAATGATR